MNMSAIDSINYLNREICLKLNNHVYSLIKLSIRKGHV